MGVMLQLKLIPERASAEKWSDVYNETLILLGAYPFMDKIIAERNGRKYAFAKRSEHRSPVDYSGFAGWNSVGDMRTGYNTEEFTLYSDIEAYRKNHHEVDNGAEILLDVFWNTEGITRPNTSCYVWDEKTQGEDSHLYLLAIACLIVDRLPQAAAVSGNINAGQVRWAVNWANQFLKKPINIPAIADMERLLLRLQKTEIPISRQIEAFFLLTLQARDQKMGECLLNHFSPYEIKSYYKGCFAIYEPGQIGFLDYLHEYLELGLDFKSLCQILVTEEHGKQMRPEAFMELIFKTKLHIKEKETFDLTDSAKDDADSPCVDGLWSLFGNTFGVLMGLKNKNVNAYYPLEQILKDMSAVFGERCDVNASAERIHKNSENADKESAQSLLYDNSTGSINIMAGQIEEVREEKSKDYDITSHKDIINFTVDSSIYPELERNIIDCFKKIHSFADTDFREFLAKNRKEREDWCIFASKYILIREEMWNYIFSRIMDDGYIKRFYGLFRVDASSQRINDFLSALFGNLTAIDYFWEQTEEKTSLC